MAGLLQSQGGSKNGKAKIGSGRVGLGRVESADLNFVARITIEEFRPSFES